LRGLAFTGQRHWFRRAGQQRQVTLAVNRLGAERTQERAVPLRVDDRPAGRDQPRPHVGDRDGGRSRPPSEQRVAAQQAADADAESAAGEFAAQPYLDAVRPAGAVQLDQRAEQRVGQPAGLAALPAALGDLFEGRVRGGAEPVPAQRPAHVTAKVHAALPDQRPRVGRPPGRPVGILPLVADDGDRAGRHLVLVPDLVEAAEVLVGGRHRHQAPPVGAEHARRAEVGAEGGRRVRRSRRELERVPVRVALNQRKPPSLRRHPNHPGRHCA
jgi:hypothetical protein